MFTENLRFDVRRSDLEFSGQMHAKAQAVEQGAGAENAVMAGELAGQKGERIGRVGDDEQHGIRCGRGNPGDYVTIDLGILVQEAQSP